MTTPSERLIFNNKYEVSEWLIKQINQSQAWEFTAEKLDEAHAYVQKYCMPDGWGANVWHTILQDAINLRKKLEEFSK